MRSFRYFYIFSIQLFFNFFCSIVKRAIKIYISASLTWETLLTCLVALYELRDVLGVLDSKKSEFGHYKYLYNLYKHEIVSLFLHFLHSNLFHFFCFIVKGAIRTFIRTTYLRNPINLLVALDELHEIFGCSILPDFMSATFRYSIVFHY